MAFFRPFVRDPFFSSPASSLFSPSHSSLLFDDDPFFSAGPLYLYDTPSSRRRAGGKGGARQQQQQQRQLKEQQASSEDNAQAMVSGGDSGAAKSDTAAAPAPSTTPSSPSRASKQTAVANTTTSNSNNSNSNSKSAVSSSLRQPRLLSPLSLLSAFSPASSLLSSHAVLPSMSVDVLSSDTEYTVHASVPGVAKQDLKVTVDDGVLTIEAERREETRQSGGRSNNNNNNNNNNDDNNNSNKPAASTSPRQQQQQQQAAPAGNTDAASSNNSSEQQQAMDVEQDVPPQYQHVESYYGHISRSITLPDDCSVDGMTAKHEDGVLKISIPRLQDKRQRGTRLEIQ